MPWDDIELYDGKSEGDQDSKGASKRSLCMCVLFHIGTSIPSIAFGTWNLGPGQQSVDRVEQAISVGFNHIGALGFKQNQPV